MQKPAQRILRSNQCLVAPAEFESAWQYQTLSHKFPIMLNKFCAGGSQRILKQRLSSTVTVSMALCGVCGVCGFAVSSALTHVPDHGPSAPDRKTQAWSIKRSCESRFWTYQGVSVLSTTQVLQAEWHCQTDNTPAARQPVISPHGSLPRTVSPSTSGLDVTRAVIASARPWATSPRQAKQIRLQWQGTRDLDCFLLRYLILETAHTCLKPFRSTYGGRHPSFSPSQTMSNTRSTAQDKGPDANCREWGGIAQGLLASDCLQVLWGVNMGNKNQKIKVLARKWTSWMIDQRDNCTLVRCATWLKAKTALTVPRWWNQIVNKPKEKVARNLPPRKAMVLPRCEWGNTTLLCRGGQSTGQPKAWDNLTGQHPCFGAHDNLTSLLRIWKFMQPSLLVKQGNACPW